MRLCKHDASSVIENERRTGAMAYKLIIFDFDGTLADTFPWLVSVLNAVADRYGFRRVEEHEVEHLRTLGAREIIESLGVPMWKLPFIARHMRELAARDAGRIRLFDGVDEVLRQLSDAGVLLAIVSSNSEDNVRRALGPEIAALVDFYACRASVFGKPAKYRKVLRQSGVLPGEVICIGDEIRDHDAARRAGLASGLVAWGFTSPEALGAQSPDAMFFRPSEIAMKIAFTDGARAVA